MKESTARSLQGGLTFDTRFRRCLAQNEERKRRKVDLKKTSDSENVAGTTRGDTAPSFTRNKSVKQNNIYFVSFNQILNYTL